MIIDPYRSLKAMAIPINLRDAMLHALEMAGAAHRRFAERDAEIKRRLIEIDAGTVELIPLDDVRSELFSESEWRESWHYNLKPSKR